jgi:hypothetical protein
MVLSCYIARGRSYSESRGEDPVRPGPGLRRFGVFAANAPVNIIYPIRCGGRRPRGRRDRRPEEGTRRTTRVPLQGHVVFPSPWASPAAASGDASR